MAHLHLGILVEALLVHVHHLCYDGRVKVGLPTAILTTELYLHAHHAEGAYHHLLQELQLGVTTASCQDENLGIALANVDDSKVAAGLHHCGDAGDEAKDAVVACHDGADQIVLNLLGNLLCGQFHLLHAYLYAVLHATVLVHKLLLAEVAEFLQVVHVLLGQGEHCLGSTWDGIAHVAAVP